MTVGDVISGRAAVAAAAIALAVLMAFAPASMAQQPLDIEVTVPINREVVVGDADNISIEFVDVLSDSRCPVDAECIVEGNAEVAIYIAGYMEVPAPKNVIFNTGTGLPKETMMDNGLQIALIALLPEPSAEMDPASYTVVLRLFRTAD